MRPLESRIKTLLSWGNRGSPYITEPECSAWKGSRGLGRGADLAAGSRRRGVSSSGPSGLVAQITAPPQEDPRQPWLRGGLPCRSYGKGSAGDLGSIRGSGRSSGEGNGNPLQYSCLGNPMDRGAWGAIVHRVAKSRTRRSDQQHYYCCCYWGASVLSPRCVRLQGGGG